MSDKRTVATDALETLGMIIDETQKRDAIHLAVEPMVAPEYLDPGEHVTATGHGCGVGEGVGIVDPFLTYRVKPGERFWLVIYPRQIKSLRHVWSHPAFSDEPETQSPPVATLPLSQKEQSEKWIREYADSIRLHWTRLMEGADDWVRSKEDSEWGDYLVDGGTLESVYTDPEFWVHYEIVRGVTVPQEHKTNFFSCSC